MLKKILAAVLVAAASFSFMPTSGASAVDNNNYCCDNYGRHHRGGCWR